MTHKKQQTTEALQTMTCKDSEADVSQLRFGAQYSKPAMSGFALLLVKSESLTWSWVKLHTRLHDAEPAGHEPPKTSRQKLLTVSDWASKEKPEENTSRLLTQGLEDLEVH